MYAIGIDLGTTGCKAIVADLTGKIVGQHYIEYPLIVRSAEEIEQDANLWWELSCQAVKGAVAESGIPTDAVKGISVTSQGISFVPVDENLKAIGNAYSWLDCRAMKETARIRKKFELLDLYRITGLKCNPTYLLPKLMWIRNNKPEDLRGARKILMAHDYLIAQMTGETITDHSMAGGSLLYDVSNGCWSEQVCSALDVDPELLPELKEAGQVAGTLTPFAAERMGLKAGSVVAVGGQDQKVAAFSAISDDVTASLCLGTAGAMEYLSDRPVFDSKMRIPLFSYLFRGTWTLEAVVSTTGASLKWLRNTFFRNQSYRELDQLAEGCQPGCGGVFFYPHLGGATSPHWEPDVKGSLTGITLNTTDGDIVRAVLEGTAFQIRSNILVSEELCKPREELVVFGSGGSSPLWCQIFADIIGKKVTALSSPDASGLGAARLAFRALGMDSAAYGSEIRQASRVYRPDPQRTERYRLIYNDYRAVENRSMGITTAANI